MDALTTPFLEDIPEEQQEHAEKPKEQKEEDEPQKEQKEQPDEPQQQEKTNKDQLTNQQEQIELQKQQQELKQQISVGFKWNEADKLIRKDAEIVDLRFKLQKLPNKQARPHHFIRARNFNNARISLPKKIQKVARAKLKQPRFQNARCRNFQWTRALRRALSKRQ
jgi:hypothetical protein